jgi:hypothetical protein
MIKKNKILVYLVTISLLILLSLNIINNVNETFINYKKCPTKKLSKALDSALKKGNSIENTNNWDLYLPCSYTKIESEISKLNLNKDQAVFGVSGTDLIASKNILYDILKTKYKSNVSNYYPVSYVPKRDDDINYFKKNFDKNKSYIIKKNIQQQKGISLSNNYNEILNCLEYNKEKVSIVQEILEDPLIVGGRKINMRVYFLVICKESSKKGYIFDDGFIYYTRKKYNPVILDFDHHITTGYIQRIVYKLNPLTHKDLYKQLENKNPGDAEKLKTNIKNLMTNIFNAISDYICNRTNIKKGISFQLFGCDVAPDKNLECKLIEINKGPDMGFKDDRDGDLKKSVMSSIFNLLNIDDDLKSKEYDNRFIPLV